jgi:chromosome segregation ATPase
MVVASVENRRAQRKRALKGLEDKQEQVEMLTEQLEDVKSKLTNEKIDTSSEEQRAESIEKSVANHEKELQQSEKNIVELKKNMYKDSQRLADLRKKEVDLIADIHGTQASIKNFTSKANELENKRTRQKELLENANFKLQQMETKVARGLGERSNDEQQKLHERIEILEMELESEKQKKLVLLQQQRKLQTELRAWGKKYESTESKYSETMLMIDTVGLDIVACEQSLKVIVAKKEEAMVSHDVTLLDVRRLRDSLRDLLEEIYSLKEHAAKAASSMQDKKDQIVSVNESKMAQLRASKDERHKSAIALGKLKIVLDKTKAKYDMVSSVNASKGEGEGFESPELKLILAAQKREELQQEGDKVDETIQMKEKEIKTMQKTLTQLKELNTNFRSSFSRADTNGANAQKLKELENKVHVAEDTLVRVRKELQVLQKSLTEDKSELEIMMGQVASHEKRNRELIFAKTQFEGEVNAARSTLDEYSKKISAYQTTREENQSRRELQYRKFHAELISLQSDRIRQLLINLGEEFPELRDDILTDMKRMGV